MNSTYLFILQQCMNYKGSNFSKHLKTDEILHNIMVGQNIIELGAKKIGRSKRNVGLVQLDYTFIFKLFNNFSELWGL